MKNYNSRLKKTSGRQSESSRSKVEISLSVKETHVKILEQAGGGNRSLGLRNILSSRETLRNSELPQASRSTIMGLEYFRNKAEDTTTEQALLLAETALKEMLSDISEVDKQ